MIITFSVDERVAQSAQDAAQKMGKSLNQAMGDYLEQLAESNFRHDQWAQLDTRCLQSSARLDGQHFNRNKANER